MPRAREAASAPHKPRCPSSSKGSFSLFLILSPPAAGIPDKRDGAQGGRSASASQLKPDHHNCCPEGLRYPCSGGGGRTLLCSSQTSSRVARPQRTIPQGGMGRTRFCRRTKSIQPPQPVAQSRFGSPLDPTQGGPCSHTQRLLSRLNPQGCTQPAPGGIKSPRWGFLPRRPCFSHELASASSGMYPVLNQSQTTPKLGSQQRQYPTCPSGTAAGAGPAPAKSHLRFSLAFFPPFLPTWHTSIPTPPPQSVSSRESTVMASLFQMRNLCVQLGGEG